MATKNKKAGKPTLQVKSCSIKLLPKTLWIKSAARAVQIHPGNAPAIQQLRQMAPGAVIPPLHIAAMTAKYWNSGKVRLTVGFLDSPPAALRTRILSHMNAWSKYGNIQFVASNVSPQVRIARVEGDGYWSYLGVDILSIKASDPTMNLDSFTMDTIDSEFYRVVRHETGHTLGFPHEHMRKEIVKRIDPAKAKAYFKKSDGWSAEEVIAQVLTPLDQSALIATAKPDPKSIMCYWLPGEIMKDGKAVPGGTDIDKIDGNFAASLYKKV
jgi:Astacin (Peptidase family M12A)